MSGTKEPVLIAWDSCVWLAWFNEERDKPLAAIGDALKESEDGKSTLIMSAVCFAEVLDIAKSPRAGTMIRQYARRKNVFRADLDFRISEKAAEIRKRSIDANDAGQRVKTIKTPDALIAATAIIYKASVLHSFDEALLKASKTPIVDGLEIVEPRSLAAARGYQSLFDENTPTQGTPEGEAAEAAESVSSDAGGSTAKGADDTPAKADGGAGETKEA